MRDGEFHSGAAQVNSSIKMKQGSGLVVGVYLLSVG